MGIVSGAVAGGTIDALVGGASFMTGALVGGLLGGAYAAWHSAKRLATLENIKNYLGRGTLYRIGPHRNPNFPWVVLDRALLHYFAVRDWAHSRRKPPVLPETAGKAGLVAELDSALGRKLGALFARIAKRTPAAPLALELRNCVERCLGEGEHTRH